MAGLSDLLRSGAAEDVDVPDDASELSGLGAGDGAPAPDADSLEPDPQPSRRQRKGRRPGRAAAQKASKADQDQVRDALTMLYTLPAWGLRLRDPHCGGALQDQRDDIVKALVPIVCRNPGMLAFFTAANAPWMDYLALFQALMPVGQTIWAHHVTHTIGHDGEQDGGGVNGVDLSAYSAPRFG
jgi:hypothetical protein